MPATSLTWSACNTLALQREISIIGVMTQAQPLVVKFSEKRTVGPGTSALESTDERDYERWLMQAGATPDVPIIVDLSGSSYADSARLSVMLKLQRAMAPKRRVAILAPNPKLSKMLRRCHVDRVIPVFTTLEAACGGLAGV